MSDVATYLGLPQFIWEIIASVVITLGSGLIIAIVTSTYLKKKEEVTRVAGVILEKRINSECEMLNYLEMKNYKYELPANSHASMRAILKRYDEDFPSNAPLQYSEIFISEEKFREFFKGYEDLLSKNKLWMEEKVRWHMMLIQSYFSCINATLILIRRIPIPSDKAISEEKYSTLSAAILKQYGILLDGEISGLIAMLDTMIVESVYKLNIKRPRKSLSRNLMLNNDMLNIVKTLFTKTMLGRRREDFFSAVIDQVYAYAGISPDKMSEDDLESIIKEVFST